MWEKIEQKHGYPVLPLLRRELLNVLYEQLPNNDTVVRFEAEVANCEVYDNGVRVHLKDGTVEEGSIVVGADGTHSRVRQVMEDLQMKENRRASKTVMAANYQSIYAVGPNRLGIPDGVFYEMRGSGIAANLVTTPTEMILILYRRLPTAALTHTYYTIEQMNEFAASFFDTTVAPGVKFGDIWGDFDKASARLVNQEEGFAKLWHHGRIALLGDSATRTTSITGLGLNLGLHSAALLANELQKCLVSDKTPDTSVLSQLFERWFVYIQCPHQRSRSKECKQVFDYGYTRVRTVTWRNWGYWAFDRFISRLISLDRLLKASICPMISDGQILSYVPFEGKETAIPWRRAPDITL
ncbi:hypothetical protein F5Y10DRAFT_277614 [Nemania abortiva]|nr:hypothetical protein F5Y10DRAFT_277614 [Nemania abortiva]